TDRAFQRGRHRGAAGDPTQLQPYSRGPAYLRRREARPRAGESRVRRRAEAHGGRRTSQGGELSRCRLPPARSLQRLGFFRNSAGTTVPRTCSLPQRASVVRTSDKSRVGLPPPASIDDVVDRRLLHCPLAAAAVVARQGEAMPVGIVQLHVIAPVVVARPPRLLAE